MSARASLKKLFRVKCRFGHRAKTTSFDTASSIVKIQGETSAFWQKLKARSTLNWELCQVILDALNGETEEDIMVFLKRLYAGLGHTGLVEDAFSAHEAAGAPQRGRRQNLRKPPVEGNHRQCLAGGHIPLSGSVLGGRAPMTSRSRSFRQPFSLHSCPSALYR